MPGKKYHATWTASVFPLVLLQLLLKAENEAAPDTEGEETGRYLFDRFARYRDGLASRVERSDLRHFVIAGDIKRQHCEGNPRILSGREYAGQLGVSRITVRRAIEELAREKYLT